MVEVQFFIPLTGNDGNLFSADHHWQFLLTVSVLFNGATFLPGETEGSWRTADGAEYHDRCRVLMIAVPSLTVAGPELREVAELARRHYGQLAILFRYLGVSEVYE